MVKEEIQAIVEAVVRDLGLDAGTPVLIEAPRDRKHGDFSTNIALLLAKRAGRAPQELAREIAARLSAHAGLHATVSLAGPGFINFKLEEGSAGRALAGLLRRGLQPGQESDFTVRDMQEVAETMTQATGTLTALLGAIAAVSLLVGGIGIMNVMLATVTERTREVGIRRALGAKRRHIMSQFLVETVALSVGGGLVGVLAGLASPPIIEAILHKRAIITPTSTAVAFAISVLIGVLAGLYPAWRAANMDPVEALRHE